MSVTRELGRRLGADRSIARIPACRDRRRSPPRRGAAWIHEIKHDDFRILAQRQSLSIRLLTRNGHDLADRFPLAAEAIAARPVRSCIIDAEAIVCNDDELAVFDLIRGHGRNGCALLCALDLQGTQTKIGRTAAAPARRDRA